MKVEILTQNGYNFLWIAGYLWMWDIPIEQTIQKNIAKEAYGEVLVVGYGLGLVQKYLMQNKRVVSVTTVEISSEVLDACKKRYGKVYGNVHLADFYNYATLAKFDCIIGDIWEDIIPEALGEYKKFKNKALSLLELDGKILAWGKDYFEYLIEKEKIS